MNDSDFAATEAITKQFMLFFPMINTIINPNNEVYKSIYFDDRNFFMFSSTFGTYASASLEGNTIQTDVSIMPYSDTIS